MTELETVGTPGKPAGKMYTFTPDNVNGIQKILRDMQVELQMPAGGKIQFSGMDLSFEFCVARSVLLAELSKERPNFSTIDRFIRLTIYIIQSGLAIEGTIQRKDLLEVMQAMSQAVHMHCADSDVKASIAADFTAIVGKHLVG